MDKEYILSCYNAQREGLHSCGLRNVNTRIALLKSLRENIKELQHEICDALKADLNKSETESYMSEIGLVLGEISYMLKRIKTFAKAKTVYTPIAHFPSKSYVSPCPKGQVLIISPWNYPFMLSIEPLVDAISAGNCVMLKPSETSSHTSAVIDKLIKKTFTPEQVCTVLGGRDQCSFLLELDFDHIFFTGSTRVGKIVMQKAAEHFTPVTLEMGGKSPCIVDETANIKLAAKRIVFGKFLNCGQTCVAPDYIYCSASIKDELVKEISRQIVLQYSVAPIENPNYPKFINEKQYLDSKKLIKKDNVLFGGKLDDSRSKIEPTILNSTFESDDMKQEIFGPVLPVVTFENIDEAIENVNKLNKPLALYIFSKSKSVQNKVVSSCDFGGGCINDTIIHIASPRLGFGGIKHSGIGAYHGKVGFDTFSHYKSIVKKKRLDLPMRYQPYSKLKYLIIKLFMR